MKNILSALLVLTLFISCSKDNQQSIDYVAKNEADIVAYVAKNKLTAQRSDSGLYYVITDPGTGANPTATSNVTVAYKGYYTDGKIFDQSTAAGISFGLNEVKKQDSSLANVLNTLSFDTTEASIHDMNSDNSNESSSLHDQASKNYNRMVRSTLLIFHFKVSFYISIIF